MGIEVTAANRSDPSLLERNSWPVQMVLLAMLSTGAFLLLGYHPSAEDGGIYAAAAAAQLDASLFLFGHGWVAAHTGRSLFIPALVLMCRGAHLRLTYALLLVQWSSILATLAVALRLARLSFSEKRHAWWAVLWFGVMAGVPVAGTSLYLLDPYVTARSVTTPLLLLALLYGVERRLWRCGLLWSVAATLHPLMALWGALPLVVLVLLRQQVRWWYFAGLFTAVCGVGAFVSAAAKDLDAVHQVALTRGYWFAAEWRWYEWVGAVLPFFLLEVFRRWRRSVGAWSAEGALLARCVTVSAGLATVIWLGFARFPGASTLVARTQPMRTLQEGYAVFLVLFAGGCLHAFAPVIIGRGKLAVWSFVGIAAAGGLLAMQRSLYESSGQVEWPGSVPRNGWEQAFVWVKLHTPTDAVFALDGKYTTLPGEDAQGFRAVALRSALPDDAKDAGVAAVVPGLAAEWVVQRNASAGLEVMSDAERRLHLLPYGVSWIVLSEGAVTGLDCPYGIQSAKVCRL